MQYAIEMYFDAESESRLYSLWDEFARFGASSMRDVESRPHVSLAVAESVDLPATHELLDRFGRSTKAFPMSLRSLGFFVFRGRIAYLAPKVTPELLALHKRFFSQFSVLASRLWQHYDPAVWVPHCTLAIGLLPQHFLPAFEACESFGLPLDCNVVEMGLIEFQPVRRLHAVPFIA
jgi:2'-5' RNA ligase